MENKNKPRVLYVDDEENSLKAFKANFRKDYEIFTANTALEAKQILASNDIHILITDQKMPGTKGTELLEQACNNYPNQVRILLTGYSDIEAIILAINKGHIFSYVKKPWVEVELKKVIDTAFVEFCAREKNKIEKAEMKEKINQYEAEINRLLKSSDI